MGDRTLQLHYQSLYNSPLAQHFTVLAIPDDLANEPKSTADAPRNDFSLTIPVVEVVALPYLIGMG